ncbi:olfactory receptor 11H2-like [Cheilinus undulatus]|uniref:olfactory receptor 11H2-like n=1 Tax=Cheilinus undulatus TaxID=241271 RepID=UPI001BD3000A|nr:olfactory receptor 11H2-like [Cheilinus undulatus]
MDERFNGTYITFTGYVAVQKFKYLYFLLMLTVYVLIICCNSTVVYLIWRNKSLHEPMYIFIAALLTNSVVLSSAVYPKFLIDFLSDTQIISYSACLFQFFIFYAVGSSEFLLLSVMAYDRYVSICKPLQYPSIMRKNVVCLFLFLAWLLPACHIAVPTILSAKSKLCNFTLKAIFCNNTIYRLQCVSSRVITIYGVFTLVDLAVLPFLFILFTYTKILVVSYSSCKEIKKKAAETCLPHVLVLICYSCLCAYDISIARVESNFPETARFIMMLQTVFYNPLLNPLIYGLKMKEISRHLRRLFFSGKV